MTADTTPESGEPADIKVRPRRWRWAYRVALGLMAALAVQIGVVEFQGRAAHRRFDDRVAAVRAAGRPASAADMAAADRTAPDGDNAIGPIIEAAKLIDPAAEPFGKLAYDDVYLPLTDDERRRLPDALAPMDRVRPLLRLAATRPAAQWHVPFTSPILDTRHQNLSPMHTLGHLLRFAALWAADRGDARAAFEAIGQMLLVARAAQAYPTVTGQFVSNGLSARAVDTLETVASRVTVGGERPTDVPPAVVGRCINALLDEHGSAAALQRALDGERVMLIDTIGRLGVGLPPVSPPGEPLGWYARFNLRMARGKFYDAGERMLAEAVPAFAAADAPDWPTCLAGLPAGAHAGGAHRPGTDDRLLLLMPKVDTLCLTHYEGIARRRAAAAGLAVRWYAADHDGRRPDALAALVPQYLPAVPSDPLTAGLPLRYTAGGADPAVYSVGQDGRDDGGADYRATGRLDILTIDERPAAGRYVGDLPFRLTPRARPPADPPVEGR